ncbi:MAG: septal ring lytic transglycosylase RlpA family protein [Gammaproteobacteria bacterium]
MTGLFALQQYFGTRVSRFTLPAILCATVALQACSAVSWDDSEPTYKSAPSTQSSAKTGVKRSKRGNPPFYEVYGVRYYVMDSSGGYRERGVASWYGKKFHGRQTSSGEIYDMYKMTAAHKTLPLPTVVRVTHLGNGKSIEVLVNDRGPFVDNRIIDLSYAAARKLDMIGSGTALVEVVALSGPGQPAKPAQTAAAPPLLTEIDPAPPPAATPRPEASAEPRLYLQVGAFGDQVNARQMQRELEAKGLSNVIIRHDRNTSPALYRVRLGPIADVAEYDALVQLMASMQIVQTHLVTETGEIQPLDVVTTAPVGVSSEASLTGG